MRRAKSLLLRVARGTLGVLSPVLKWVGASMVLASCVLAVYLAAVLLARFAVWAGFP